MKIISPLIVALGVVFWGLGITAAPSQQITPLPPGIALQATIDGLVLAGTQTRLDYIALEERVAILEYGRDSQMTNTPIPTDWQLATDVATITQSGTPAPSQTATRTPSPSATRTPVIAAPTETVTPQGTAPTPTLDEVPMEPTDEIAGTPVHGDLVYFYGNATSGNINIRACAGLSCPVVGTLPEHGSLGLCAGTERVVGSHEWMQVITAIGAPHEWIAVRNVDSGALLMAALGHEQVSTDTDCE